MEVRRTAPVTLVVPDEDHDDLHETADQFLYCANEASDYCWDNTDYEACVTSNLKARDASYRAFSALLLLVTQSSSSRHAHSLVRLAQCRNCFLL
jgi:hypothetical protein